MPNLRKTLKNKLKRSRKSSRKTGKRIKVRKGPSRKMRGGDCGCDKPQGGGAVAGESNLDGLSKDHYYPLSDGNRVDNTNMSSRLIGGKRHRQKRTQKLVGGSSMYAPHNAVSSFGDANSVNGMYKLLTNTNVVDPAVYNQPVANTYGIHSPPLV